MKMPDTQRPTPNFRTVVRSRAGFTLFELLSVLTIIGICLAMLLGNYGSWGAAHGFDGAARTVEAGLQQARDLALTRHAYVAFNYGTTNASNNALSSTTGFQPFFCTNVNDTAISETGLQTFVEAFNEQSAFLPFDGSQADIPDDILVFEPAAPFQRLPGHVVMNAPQLIIFRPDGSLLFDARLLPSGENAPSINIAPSDGPATDRTFRIDPATGHVTVSGETTP